MALAAEESSKSKAAKEVIKSLTAQVYTLHFTFSFLATSLVNFYFDMICISLSFL